MSRVASRRVLKGIQRVEKGATIWSCRPPRLLCLCARTISSNLLREGAFERVRVRVSEGQIVA